MTVADSVSVFAEGTFEEQIQELVNYIIHPQSEEDRAVSLQPFLNALKTEEGQKPLEEDEERRKKVFSMVIHEGKDFGQGSDREIEGFFNLVFSHLFTLYSPDAPETKQHLASLLRVISSQPLEKQPVKYRILSNLFNAIPRTSSLRVIVYNRLLEMAATSDELEALQLNRTDVERWISEWQISPDEKSDFLKSLVKVHEKAGQFQAAYEYTSLYLQSLPTTSSETEAAAVQLITTALRLPTILDFDPLLKYNAVVALKDHELFSLLQIYLNHGLPEFIAWESAHPGVYEKYKLDKTELQRKIRLLTFASLASKHVGQDLPYSKVSEALQVNVDDVEKWAIDVIRAGLVWTKLSQTSQTLRIIRATARVFEKEQWEVLEKRLLAWKSSLNGVLEVISSATKQAGIGQDVVVA